MTTPIPITAPVISRHIIAPERIVSDIPVDPDRHYDWTTDTGAFVTTDAGVRIEFYDAAYSSDAYPLLVANPYTSKIIAHENDNDIDAPVYSNRIIAPEKE